MSSSTGVGSSERKWKGVRVAVNTLPSFPEFGHGARVLAARDPCPRLREERRLGKAGNFLRTPGRRAVKRTHGKLWGVSAPLPRKETRQAKGGRSRAPRPRLAGTTCSGIPERPAPNAGPWGPGVTPCSHVACKTRQSGEMSEDETHQSTRIDLFRKRVTSIQGKGLISGITWEWHGVGVGECAQENRDHPRLGGESAPEFGRGCLGVGPFLSLRMGEPALHPRQTSRLRSLALPEWLS